MKRIIKSIDASQLHVLKDLLETNGIPALINGENTARIITPFLMTEPSLWVYLDEQRDEALRLIEDPDYEVVNKVDMIEFYKVADTVTDKPESLNTALVYLAATMAVVLLGLLALVKVLEWLLV
ncbi:MAG: DUF2007 domain-containing protein [Gammaproteobacteria bacterium]|jgi:hypothetical protein|nr:DUF2007 domain-containing protein [Gammaproteobacteria bacterium]MDH3887187.1 DUF2007 domain-containing protein [Gammaproteobacteria bacterium]MDH3986411.1 DUF2007 domain-containing protein [Gammaproteobacteria bacterium]